MQCLLMHLLYLFHFRCTEGWCQSITKILPFLPRYNCQHSIIWLWDIQEGLIIKSNQEGCTIDHHESYAIWGLSQKAIFTASRSITALVKFFRILTKIMVGTCTIIRRSSRHMTLISLVAHPPSIFKVNYFN